MDELLLMLGRLAVDIDRIQTFKVTGRLREDHLSGLCELAGQRFGHQSSHLVHEEKVSKDAVFDDVLEHFHAVRLRQHVHLIGFLELFMEQPVQDRTFRCLCY